MVWRRWLAVIALMGLAGACAAPVSKLPELSADAVKAEERRQQVAQIRRYYAELARVDGIAFRLRVANSNFCKTVSPQIGMHAVTVRSLPRRYQSFSREALNVSWTEPTVIAVVDGSPAAAAGIQAGDQVLALNDVTIPDTGTARWIARYLRRHGLRPMRAALRRDDIERTAILYPVMACAIPINYVTADDVNATTYDDRIVINSAIATLARTDAQLATVIGHELAHANLGHLDKRRINALAGATGGALIDGGFLLGGIYTGGAFTKQLAKTGALVYSVEFEREADYVGAYYAARAGYDIAGAEEFWHAIGQTHPGNIQFAGTHPTSPQRFLQMRAVAAEIADKKRRHLPLVPELKEVAAAPDPAVRDSESF